MFRKLFLLLSFLVLGVFSAVADGVTPKNADEPIFRIGILSDLHNQQSLISGDASSVQLRGTVNTILNAIKQKEKLDLLVLNGDYTSDVTIPEANWKRVRELIVNATRNIFPSGSATPVIYCNGNHEYEVANFDQLPKPYNAGDYYTFPMRTDIGELGANNSFYEKAENGALGETNLLAAYSYVIKGFDCVVLNTGKHFFKYAWDYQYSVESVRWIADKLEQIYAGDPNKTVFFFAHVPFSDSKSMSNANKGLKDCEATTLLKTTLAKYPNLIHIYGHDHGSDNAYIRTETAQRVTQYDSKGNLYATSTVQTPATFYIQNAKTDKYLGRTSSSDNIDTFSEPMSAMIKPSATAGMFNIVLASPSSENNVYCGTSGRFSGNRVAADLSLYEVVTNENGAVSATQVTTGVESGKSYLIVGLKNGIYYALTNKPYSSGIDFRLEGTAVTISGKNLTYTDANTSDNYTAIWKMSEKKSEVDPGIATPSFISAFAGSLRYYSNSIDGGSSVNDSKVAQALMVYVYKDSVVLQMRNYAQVGLINGITIKEIPASYKSIRKVTNTGVVETGRTVAITVNDDKLGTVKITSPQTDAKTITTEEPVTIAATPDNSLVDFINWTGSDGGEISKENPFTYSGKTDITLTANFREKEYPRINHTFEANKMQENRFLDKVTYTTATGTKEIFNLNLGTGQLSAFPANVNLVSGGSAMISYLEPVIEIKEGESSFGLTCYSTHYSIVIGGVTYKNNMTWVNQNAYVDWNNDLDFADAGETYIPTNIDMTSSSTNPPTHPFRLASGYTRTISIPANTPVGKYRMYVAYGQDTEPEIWSFSKMFANKTVSRGNVYEFNISVVPSVPLSSINVEGSSARVYISGNVLHVQGLSGKSDIRIMDCSGKLLVAETITEQAEINLPEIMRGIYLVKIINNGNVISKKLAK